MISFLLAASLVASSQTSAPTVHLIGDAQEGIALETLTLSAEGAVMLTGRYVLPLGGTLAVKLDGSFHALRMSSQGRGTLTLTANDLAAGTLWHVSKLPIGNNAVFVWTATSHVGRALPQGSVIVTAETAACASAETFRLASAAVRAFENQEGLAIATTTDVAACRWIVSGLPAGTYTAALRNASGSSGRQSFRVVPERITEVVIPPPTVTVSGVVTLNGRPASGGRVQFRRGGTLQAVVLQDDGSYMAAFDEEGEFTLVMLAPMPRLKPTMVALTRGANVFDWTIDEPSANSELNVRVSGQDRLAETGVEVESNGIVIMRGFIPAGHDTFTRRGLPFGKYRVFAHQTNASSEWSEVELSESVPAAGLALSLVRATRSITLRYADGDPVTNAGFGNTTHGPEETSPGTYSLASVAANTELLIRPPTGAPLCRIVPREADIEATVMPGRSLTLKFQDRRLSIDYVKIQSEGACPVSILLFLKSPVRVGDQTADVEVLNAPPDESLVIHTRDGAFRVVVPPEGIVFIPWR